MEIMGNLKSYKVVISGLVQGVGFRPFVYRVAKASKVNGYVKNLGGSEVEVRIEGDSHQIGEFLHLLFTKLPPPARIESVRMEEEEFSGLEGFSIAPSGNLMREPSQIPPDLAVCDECMREVLDPKDRRYHYPFNSCAYCGPRFSMLYKVPYDRENTAMRDFPLCDLCSKEYYDSENERRFDAQGISCPSCGPKLFLETIDGEGVDGDPIEVTAKLLSEGYVVAVKGIGGFHIAVDPFNDDVVLKLRERKNRPQQPFAVMALSLNEVKRHAYVSKVEEDLLTSPERPIVLLKKREDYSLSRFLSPGLDREGFFLYYTPLHYLLLERLGKHVLVMTSGNKHGFPMCTDERCVKERLKGVVDFVLYHNRKIVNRVDDSVVRVSNNRVLMIRRSRGYAPLWIKVKGRRFVHSMAVGAELQNAGAVGFDDKVVLTQYIGDTDDLESLEDLEKYLEFFSKLYSLRPKIVVSDKNPGYQSSYLAQKLAERYNAELVRIQHHYAHVLSVAADHGLEEGVGIAIDGIGYGDDGNAWGGEVIKFSGEKYERIYHLRYVPYVGGDVNALRPKRMLALFLSQFMGFDEISGLTGLKDVELAFLEKAVKRRGLMTSSLGRFLDAVSAFLGICNLRTYEGEPAMKLEASAMGGKLLDMEIPLVGEEIDTVRAFQWMIENWGKYRVNDLAYTVQYKVGEALVKAALKLSPESILVSGGAAVNEYVLKGIAENSEGVPVLTPRRVPAGDGGIALGQIYYTTFMS
ncbi:MAG: (NiFe) hydrogenase maturation protein HypF [Candidatus Aramenus sulfurataquae]|uniref:Carbamoyltransferase n=1 Tax=Candidatus Aramenus sulfurataquae TaxID=1326980 RepID=W7KVP8_9CREN|nr:MAG: (NiFe) hydrogenase maturation protein HypF [Candidatus Aramenus sulfurataquae]